MWSDKPPAKPFLVAASVFLPPLLSTSSFCATHDCEEFNAKPVLPVPLACSYLSIVNCSEAHLQHGQYYLNIEQTVYCPFLELSKLSSFEQHTISASRSGTGPLIVINSLANMSLANSSIQGKQSCMLDSDFLTAR